jgi:hypothetical protein
MKKLIPLFALALPLAACELPVTNCTEEARPSVMVDVEDESGALITDAVVEVDAGDGVEDCWGQAGEFACGTEQAGDLDILVSAEGFESQTVTVTVEADECHVLTEDLVVVLLAVTE